MIGPDLFGGKWPEIPAAEMEKRMTRAEAEKEKQQQARMVQKKSSQGQAPAKEGSNQTFHK